MQSKFYAFTVVLFILVCENLMAQRMYRPSDFEISTLPLWTQKMYSLNPNVWEVDNLYKSYYRENPFEKSYHTQYYKRWRRSVENRISEDGFVLEKYFDPNDFMPRQAVKRSTTNWTVVGPIYNTRENGVQGSGQTNVYSLDQCAGATNVLYCGTEPGEVYKSVDGGVSWENVSMDIHFGSGVNAVEVHPSNPNIVFAGGGSVVYRTLDGGITWASVMTQNNLNVNEILINPSNTQVVMIAGDAGLYRSVDGGNNWTQLFAQRTYDLKTKPGNAQVVYMVKNNPALIKCEFFISQDMGATWALQSNGWYHSTDPARTDGGARIAVSAADTNRVYAYLIGEAKANDYGFIGVYRSNDGGQSWALPNSPPGGPYTTSHPNLAYGVPSWTYHQGFYNCALAASSTNADHILIGGLNLWRSNDGGATFSAVAGYVGGPMDIHVDMQDFRVFGNQTWITTDGGINMSTDFFTSTNSYLMQGIHGSDYWGFGSGWNEDVLVGGLYHNGNLAHHENYGQGVFLELGGGEAPTGYVNPGNNRKTYYSDIGGALIPQNLNSSIIYFSSGMSPNESYWAAESSEMEFHPNCYNMAYLGKENKLWKTQDGGASYNLVHTFGTSVNNQIKYIEISSSNPNVIYLNQQPNVGNTGTLWKSTNGGQSWNTVTIPAGNSRRMLLAINPENENELWIAYPGGSNGSKVFHTNNGGTSWTNITSTLLNGESVQALVHIAGTDGALYVGTEKSVFYKDANNQWTQENAGLPFRINVNILRPFYRDGKIRLASYGKGIWQSALNTQPARPIARITVDKLEQAYFCELDSFRFEDYSFLNHNNAQWSWAFPTGQPTSSTQRNPAVHFAQSGQHLAILTVTNGQGQSSTDSLWIHVAAYQAPQVLNEGFQSNFPPEGWTFYNQDQGATWTLNTGVGAYGSSSQSVMFDNYYNDSQGTADDFLIPFNSQGMSQMELYFDVAYTPYGGQYSDTLKILVSTDCGASFTQLFVKGGNDLSTAPSTQNFFVPNNSQWRTELINLDPYTGHDKLLIAFRNTGYYGNAMYIDNINLSGNVSVGTNERQSAIRVFPNPTAGMLRVESSELMSELVVTDVLGKELLRKKLSGKSQEIDLSKLTPGMYLLQVHSSTGTQVRRVVVHR